jgi:hypothetical protein
LIERQREFGPQELVTVLPDRLICRPSVQFLSSSVPIRDDVVEIAHENGVMREIEQIGLLSSYGHFPLEFVAGLQKLLLYAATHRAEPDEKYRKQNEDEIIRQLGTANVEAVEGLGEKIVEGQTREHYRQNGRPVPCKPRCHGKREQEQWERHLAHAVALQDERCSQDNRDRYNRKTVPLNRSQVPMQ